MCSEEGKRKPFIHLTLVMFTFLKYFKILGKKSSKLYQLDLIQPNPFSTQQLEASLVL